MPVAISGEDDATFTEVEIRINEIGDGCEDCPACRTPPSVGLVETS